MTTTRKKTHKLITMLLLILSLITAIPPATAQAATAKKPVITSKQATIKKNATVISKGTKVTLKAMSSKTNVTTKVKWTSNKKSVVTVSKKGVLTAKKAGTAYITATYKGKTSKLKVTVAQVKLNKSSLKLKGGGTYRLKAVYNKKAIKAKYKSSNPAVAIVNTNGTVTALKKGTATVTAVYANSKASCKITVTSNAKKPVAPVHQHTWVAVTKKQWVDTSWDEEITRAWCDCGAIFATYDEWAAHSDAAIIAEIEGHGDGKPHGGYTTSSDIIHHEDGYYKNVVTGYRCSCGATKAK